MSALEAILTLIVGVLASGALTEIVKRHNLRSSILTDLDIWEKLPDGATKTKLYDDLTTRVWQMTMTATWPSVVYGLVWWAGSIVLIVVTYGVKLQRDDQGVMRVVGVGINLQLYYAAMFAILYAVLLSLAILVGSAASKKFSKMWNVSQAKKGVEDAKKRVVAEYSTNPTAVEMSRKLLDEGTTDPVLLAMARGVVEAADAEEPSGDTLPGTPQS